MGNLFAENALDKLKGGLGGMATPQQPQFQDTGIVSRMLAKGEDPGTLPKKSFLAGAGWKPPSPTWSPWDMWSAADVSEGSQNANRSLAEAMAVKNRGVTQPSPTTPSNFRAPAGGTISDIISAQPVPGETKELGTTPVQRQATKKRKRNKPFSPYGTTPSSMGMY